MELPKTTIELEREEAGLETTRILGMVTIAAPSRPPLSTFTPFDIFVLVDAGAGMQENNLKGIKESINSIFFHLGEKHTFSLVVYSYSLELSIPFMVCTPQNKAMVMGQLDAIIPQSSANHYLGLRTIFELMSKSKNPALIFYSSGLCDEQHLQMSTIKSLTIPRGCITNIIGVGVNQNSKLLYGISHHFRGIYHYAPNPLDIFCLTNKCMTNILSTVVKEILITLDCFDGCRMVSWSSSFEVIEKNFAKSYDIHIGSCSSNEKRTFIFGLSVKSMRELENVDPKTGKIPMIWLVHPLVSVRISYLNLMTGNTESFSKDLSVLRVRFPGYYPLSKPFKESLGILEAIDILNKYIKDQNPVYLTQLPDDVKKEITASRGLHKIHLICAYVSSHFFEKFT